MTLFLCIEITSEFDAFLDKIQVVLDVVGVIPVFGDVADGLNAVISLCRGNYLEALICLVAILPMGDLLKGLKFADKAKDILKLGDKALTATKTVAKEGAEKLSKQMTKLVKSGKIDNVIATMDAGKDFVVKFKNGSTALIKKGDLSEFVCQAFNKGCFMAGTLVTTKEGLKPIEEVKIGEYVLSRNEESGETSYKKVTDTLIRSTYNICTIELENGKIKSTTGHLFMVKDKWWKAAAELKVGDILETADEQCQRVKSITVEEKAYPVTTYNLSVEDNHTFFVGKLGVLTHNKGKFNKCDYVKIDGNSIKVNFNRKDYDKAEYLRQLKKQEEGMQNLTVKEFLENRDRFKKSGRAKESAVAQQKARKNALDKKVNELLKNNKKLSYSEAKEEASKWLTTQAALHNPDQIAGGIADIINDVGDIKINSSIGYQWRGRIGKVEEKIIDLSRDIAKEELEKVKIKDIVEITLDIFK